MQLISHTPRSTAADRQVKAAQQEIYVRDLWILLGSILAFLTIIRFTRLAIRFAFPPTPPSQTNSFDKSPIEKVEPGCNGRPSWRRLPGAVASAFRIVAFRIHIPIGPGSTATISQLTFIFGYITTIFVLLFIHTHDLEGYWYEDRAAHYASSQLPLIVALAGKNNIISFCTGIGHEKLNVLHRAAARTCLILLWIHAISHVVAGLKTGFETIWMQCGAVGLTAFTLAAILSVRPIRKAFFEIFLVGHIILVALFLLFGYLHARGPGYGNYIWPALVLWAFDRVLRLTRLLLNNRFRWTKNQHESTATVELLSQDTVRLTLRRRMKWQAGQHAYVVLPTISELPSEAHPFTIASIPGSLDGAEGSQEKELTFIIRGRSGFTGRLRDHASSDGSKTVPAFIDGPYGCPPILSKYYTCVLIAGGSGVSYTLPLLLNLIHDAKAGKSAVRRVVFVWSVRDAEHVKWISKVLKEALVHAQSSPLVVDPHVYITGPNHPLPELSLSDDSKSVIGDSHPGTPVCPKSENSLEKLELPAYSALKITHGRPSISRILEDEVSGSAGSVSVDGKSAHLPGATSADDSYSSRWAILLISSCIQIIIIQYHEPYECLEGSTFSHTARRSLRNVASS
ncbi:hypothetical protein EUX98_g541 [Antrodiella citrinella]|uniref:ferric-chelate reductase (NADPH) n=1 Tax=Antrodiella citrinella TaxID=2447956 RepID=A0A4S4NCC7_9APHY|nr:hypothetical protein EUX98_g541 [Antrodiella citrinella]